MTIHHFGDRWPNLNELYHSGEVGPDLSGVLNDLLGHSYPSCRPNQDPELTRRERETKMAKISAANAGTGGYADKQVEGKTRH